MSTTPEGRFWAQLGETLRRAGALTFKIHGHAMQAPGWPDVLVFHHTWTGALELKAGKNKLSQAQRLRLEALSSRGFPALCLRHVTDRTAMCEQTDGTELDTVPTNDGAALLKCLSLLTTRWGEEWDAPGKAIMARDGWCIDQVVRGVTLEEVRAFFAGKRAGYRAE